MRRLALIIALTGTMFVGSCSFKSIGAGLLSEYLTTGSIPGLDSLTT